MAERITAPINYPVIAGGKIVKGGSVVFGEENVKPDPDNISTLKPVYLDSLLSAQAANPQGLSSDGVFDQSDTGILFGADGDKYSILVLDQNGVELSYIASYDLSDANAAATAQQAASDAQSAESGASLAATNTQNLFDDFVNRYFGAYTSDPALDSEGNPPSEGSLYFNTVNETFKVYDSGTWKLPQDLGFGTAAYVNTGTASNEIPLNSDLGTASTKDVQTSPTDATAGRLLNNETTEIGGFVNYTGANYQPEISLGLGVVRIMSNKTGANVLDGSEISGANLRVSVVLSSGAWTATATAPTGTWKHVSGVTIANNEFGYFTRTA